MSSGALFSSPAGDRSDALLEALWRTPGWPRDEAKDRQLLAELGRQFPELNLADELGKFAVFVMERELTREVSGRGRYMRLRNWCQQTRKPYRGAGRAGGFVRRTSPAPRPVEAFGGESSQQLSRW